MFNHIGSYWVTVLLEYFIIALTKLQEGVTSGGPVGLQDEVAWFMKVSWNVALLCGDACQEMYQLFLTCYKVCVIIVPYYLRCTLSNCSTKTVSVVMYCPFVHMLPYLYSCQSWEVPKGTELDRRLVC